MTDTLLNLLVGSDADRAEGHISSANGAETVQVVMIMGIMAILVVALFFTDIGLADAIKDLGTKVKDQLGVAGS